MFPTTDTLGLEFVSYDQWRSWRQKRRQKRRDAARVGASTSFSGETLMVFSEITLFENWAIKLTFKSRWWFQMPPLPGEMIQFDECQQMG